MVKVQKFFQEALKIARKSGVDTLPEHTVALARSANVNLIELDNLCESLQMKRSAKVQLRGLNFKESFAHFNYINALRIEFRARRQNNKRPKLR